MKLNDKQEAREIEEGDRQGGGQAHAEGVQRLMKKQVIFVGFPLFVYVSSYKLHVGNGSKIRDLDRHSFHWGLSNIGHLSNSTVRFTVFYPILSQV